MVLALILVAVIAALLLLSRKQTKKVQLNAPQCEVKKPEEVKLVSLPVAVNEVKQALKKPKTRKKKKKK